jgi:competence protein ComEC
VLFYFSAAFLIFLVIGAGPHDVYFMQAAQPVLVVGCLARHRSPRVLAMLVGCAAALFALWLHRPHPGTHLLRSLAAETEGVLLRGEVLWGPEVRPARTVYDVLVDDVDGVSIIPPSRVRISVPRNGQVSFAWPGDLVEVFGSLTRFVGPEFPRVRSRRLVMEGRGLAALTLARDGPQVVRVGGASFRREIAMSKHAFQRWVLAGLDELESSMVLALTTGNRTFLPPSYIEPFRKTDTAHLLAISGLHFGALSHWLFGLGLALVGFGRPWLRPLQDRCLVSLVTSVSLGVYLVWIGAPLSAQRAWLMCVYGLAAGVLCRHGSGIHSLLMAAVVIGAIQPSALFEVGFQLSFASVSGIVVYVERSGARWDGSKGSPFALVALREAMCISVVAGLSTWPVWLCHVGQIHPVGLVANWFAVPWVTLVVFPLFSFGVILSPVAPEWSLDILGLGCINLSYLHSILDVVAGAPTLLCGVQPAVVVGPVAFALLIFVSAGDRFVRGVSGACFVGLLLVLGPPEESNEGCTRVWFLPVGQGDAIYVEGAGGLRMLIDAGGSEGPFDPGRRIVVPFLTRRGVRSLDAVIASHADLDHAGGLMAVLEELDVDRLVFHPRERRGVLLELEALAVRRGIEVISIEGEQTWSWAHPFEIIFRSLSSDEALSSNDRSLTVELRMGRSRVILTGDIEAAAEEQLASQLRRDSNVFSALKVPHHGSKTSTSHLLLEMVDPDVAIISVGSTNRFGHPHPDVLDRLHKRGVPVLRTDRDGLVEVSFCPRGQWVVRSCRGAQAGRLSAPNR